MKGFPVNILSGFLQNQRKEEKTSEKQMKNAFEAKRLRFFKKNVLNITTTKKRTKRTKALL